MKQIARVVVPDGRGRFLSVLEGNRKGRVSFPGGHIEKGELPHEAAARELYEETGLTALSLTLICQVIDRKRHNFIFQATATGSPRGSSEGEVGWATPEAFMEGHYGDFARAVFACWIQANLP